MKFALLALVIYAAPNQTESVEEHVIDYNLSYEDCSHEMDKLEQRVNVRQVSNVTMTTIFTCEQRT